MKEKHLKIPFQKSITLFVCVMLNTICMQLSQDVDAVNSHFRIHSRVLHFGLFSGVLHENEDSANRSHNIIINEVE